jgi:multidrug efflux system membrane fusion protein
MKKTLIKYKNFYLLLSKNLKILVILLSFLLLWLVSGLFKHAKDDKIITNNMIARVIFINSIAEEKIQTIQYHSISEANKKNCIFAPGTGRVYKLLVEKGDEVKYHQELAIISPPDFASILSGAQAQVREIEEDIADEDTPSLELLAKLSAAQDNLKKAQSYSKNMIIRAPFDGRIEKVFIDSGQDVALQEKVFLIVDPSKLIFKIDVPEKNIENIRNGDLVEISATNGVKTEGWIKFVGNSSNQQNLTFEVEVILDNSKHNLPEGITADVSVPVGSAKVHALPLSSLVINDKGELGVMTLSLQEGKDIAIFKAIEIFEQNNDFVWVMGLNSNEKVITMGQGYIKSGSEVIAKAAE